MLVIFSKPDLGPKYSHTFDSAAIGRPSERLECEGQKKNTVVKQ